MAVAKRIERWMASTFSGEDSMRKPTALISVFDKTGIVELARGLVDLGWDIISSGGTAKALRAAGLEVRDVAELSGLAAILDHRVVTLVPQVHAGLLALDKPEHDADRAKINAPCIDMVCVNLYPLEAAIAKPDATTASVIESTDIGGPTLLSSAAKGRRVVICDPADYGRVLAWLKEDRPNTETFVTELCAKADGMVAGYRLASARYHSSGAIEGMIGTRVATCKYGENAWQTPAGLYSYCTDDTLALDKFELVQGQPPSFINWCDVDRMLQTVTHIAAAFDESHQEVPSIAIGVKHGNPCGVGISDYGRPQEIENSLMRMIEGDTRAIFGGFVMTNFSVNEYLADILLSHGTKNLHQRLLDGIVAPNFTDNAVKMLKRKGDKCRLLVNPALKNLDSGSLDRSRRLRQVRGGFLAQPNYTYIPELYRHVQGTVISLNAFYDLLLAWAVGSTSNSNTITLVKNGKLIGNGVGQQDRVGAARLALQRACDAGHDVHGAVAYSDSFFPFPDGPQALIDNGITTIMATSGSVNDKLTIELCEKHDVKLILIPDAESRGFFGH
ncbi:MAG: hypothetical protein WCT54_05730 [Patescibacteria group bacterium]